MGSAVNRMALAWHCICGGGGLFSGSLDMLVVPSHMLPSSTNCPGRAKAGRAQDVLLESFSCPFMCPFGPRASQASGRAERRRSEDERVFKTLCWDARQNDFVTQLLWIFKAQNEVLDVAMQPLSAQRVGGSPAKGSEEGLFSSWHSSWALPAHIWLASCLSVTSFFSGCDTWHSAKSALSSPSLARGSAADTHPVEAKSPGPAQSFSGKGF